MRQLHFHHFTGRSLQNSWRFPLLWERVTSFTLRILINVKYALISFRAVFLLLLKLDLDRYGTLRVAYLLSVGEEVYIVEQVLHAFLYARS